MTTNSQNPASSGGQAAPRAQRKSARGKVVSNKMQKTIVVQVDRKVRHPLYEKYMSRRTKLYAHDEAEEAGVGDVVEIMQTRPLSKLKRWRLLRVVQRSTQA